MNIFSRITFRHLKKNKTRTLITIIGIILSTAMFVAVTTAVSSVQHFILDYEIKSNGNWHGMGTRVSYENMEKIRQEDKVDQLVSLRLLGFSPLADGQNKYKPYLCVQAMSEGFLDRMPVYLTEGRMPENSSEILLPNHLYLDGGISHELGDVLTLSLGDRMSEAWRMGNDVPFYPEEEVDAPETLENLHTSEYTVVGFYERPNFEEHYAPGYTALTVQDDTQNVEETLYEIYFTLKNAGETEKFLFGHGEQLPSFGMNYGLLRATGDSGEDSLNSVMYGLAAILIAVIMFGSVSLIYNAFSISVSERTKQFGILSSVGATRKQLMKSVMTEGVFLGTIGIPLGILAGLFGMGITFHFVGEKLAEVMFRFGEFKLTLHPSILSLVIAAVLSLITILISAFLPAKRASKKSAIDAIRQSSDVKIRAKKLKVSPVIRKLFGFEGTIATKNYKRSRKKYRATVFSIFISVVLFVSASSFGAYLEYSAGIVYEDRAYNLMLTYYPDPEDEIGYEEIEEEIRSLSDVKEVAYSSTVLNHIILGINSEALNEKYLKYELSSAYGYGWNGSTPDEVLVYANIYFVDDEEFKRYLKEQGLSEEGYFDSALPKAVAVGNIYEYNPEKEKYDTYRAFDKVENAEILFHPQKNIIGYDDYGMFEINEQGEYLFKYAAEEYYELEPADTMEEYEEQQARAKEEGILLELPPEEATVAVPIACDAVSEKGPEMTYAAPDSMVALYLPYSQLENLLRFYIEEFEALGMDEMELSRNSEESYLYYNLPLLPLSDYVDRRFAIVCDHHTETAAELKTWISDAGIEAYVTDYDERLAEERTMLLIVRIFSYGFIILISLIAAANVLNTISTNVHLRRREFAMLKSVGLTPKGFHKMMVYECLLYGIKGLLYGLPASVGVTWLIYRAVSNGIEMEFFIPWNSVVIVVGSVFFVVALSMVYAVNKIRNKNTVDELKNENF